MTALPLLAPGAGLIEINHLELSYPWVRIMNMQDMRNGPMLRGSDVTIPNVQGVRARRRRATAFPVTLRMYITGAVDPTGDPYADPVAGLWSNINILRAEVVDPPGTGDGTRELLFTDGTETTVTVDVHVVGFTLGEMVAPALIAATLELSFPAGTV
jgi:hypothetical protein